jgi:hypothetical protein
MVRLKRLKSSRMLRRSKAACNDDHKLQGSQFASPSFSTLAKPPTFPCPRLEHPIEGADAMPERHVGTGQTVSAKTSRGCPIGLIRRLPLWRTRRPTRRPYGVSGTQPQSPERRRYQRSRGHPAASAVPEVPPHSFSGVPSAPSWKLRQSRR